MKLAEVLDWFGFSSHAPAAGHHHSDGDEEGHGHTHHHSDGDEEGHGHTHGVIDPTIASTERGIWAIKWSFVLLALTAVIQIIVVAISGSVALLADTIHNFADATTAIPLWVAFRLARRKPTETFTYGYGRVEDLAGIVIVAIILFSAIVAGYEAIDRIFHPQPIGALTWVAIAGIIGFIGNEAVAVFRIRVGLAINSAALIADGYHARTDGLTSLAVVVGAIGVWLGFPLADPIIGLLITIAIFGIVWQSVKSVLTRMLDGVEPGLVAEIRHSAEHVKDIKEIVDVKARWLGHKLHTDVAILVDGGASMNEADKISAALKKELFAHIPVLTVANVRVHGAAPETVNHRHEIVHHHAPEPCKIATTIATGLLAIVDTPKGERMRLTLDHPVAGLTATVTIERPEDKVEVLPLVAVANNPLAYQSAVAPEEPHEFSAQLRLKVADQLYVSHFKMAEPAEHHH